MEKGQQAHQTTTQLVHSQHKTNTYTDTPKNTNIYITDNAQHTTKNTLYTLVLRSQVGWLVGWLIRKH